MMKLGRFPVSGSILVATIATLSLGCDDPRPRANQPALTVAVPAHPGDAGAHRARRTDEEFRTTPEMEKALEDRYGSDDNKKRAVRAALAQVDRIIESEKILDAENQRSMVLPRRPDFAPADSDRKGVLRVFLNKSKIHPGELLRFRLELENVGRKPFDYREFKPSVFKSGGLDDSDFMHFIVIGPRGEAEELIPAAASEKLHTEPTGQQGMVEISSSEWNRDPRWRAEESYPGNDASNHFLIHLKPGETLRSLGDGHPNGRGFRTLYCEQDFTIPGRYRLIVRFDDRLDPPSPGVLRSDAARQQAALERKAYEEDLKDALGPLESNAAYFEVVP